jgi:polyhydroxybutyrate depolymerase
MKSLLFGLMIPAIALFLISCGGSGGSGSSGGTGSNPPSVNAPACDTVPAPTCHSIAVTQSDGSVVVRYYVLHVPANFPATSGALVVALHGTGESGLEFEQHTLMDTTSEADGFAVAYPDGSLSPRAGDLRQWNAYFNGEPLPTDVLPDDVAFIRQLIASLQATLDANPKKIYVTGISAGGFMAIRAGVEISDLVAAIAPLSGALDAQQSGYPPGVVPAALGPVSVIMLHADQDTPVPYCGGEVSEDSLMGTVASQDTTFNYWVAADAAPTLDTTTALCDVNGNPTSVNEKDATGGALNTEVKFYRLIGADHFAVYNNANLSSYNPNFNSTTGVLSNDIVWNFFAAHPKP